MTNTRWIEWDGGSCPVPESTLVEVKFRDGSISGAHCAGYWNWHWQPYNSKYDIVAYRFPEPPMTDDLEDELKRLREEMLAKIAAGRTDIDFAEYFAKIHHSKYFVNVDAPCAQADQHRTASSDLDDEEKRLRDQLRAEIAAGKTDIDYLAYFEKLDAIRTERGKRMLPDNLDDEEKRLRDQLSAEIAAGKTDIDYAKYFVNVFVNVDPIGMEMAKRMLDAFLAKRAEKKKKKNPPPGSNQ